jgi:hypothetical protein
MTVTFESSAFNSSTPEKHFIHSRPYGSDLANWLVNELTRRNASTEPMIWQRDSEWLVRFRFRGISYDFLVRYQDTDWVGLLERRRGIVSRLFRARQKNVEFDAVLFLNGMLSSSELISDVCWHYDESSGAM